MKSLIFILSLFVSLQCFANETHTVCRGSNAVTLVLHKEVNGTVSESADNHWAVRLPYDIFSGATFDGSGSDVLSGISACSMISVKSAADGSSYDGGTISPGDVNTFAKMPASNEGTKCWCKMEAPMTSYWTYVKEYADASTCASECTSYCANGFANNTEMSNGRYVRNALIDAVW